MTTNGLEGNSETTAITIEMPVEMHDRICHEINSDSEAAVSAWVLQAIRVMHAYCDSQRVQTINVDVEVPESIADRVRLDYERRRPEGQSRDEYLTDALDEFFSIEPRYVLDDEVIEAR